MQTDETQSALAAAFRIEAMPEAEKEAFLERSGAVIVDAAVTRLLLSLAESELAQLELYLDTHEDMTDIFGYLMKTYPSFSEIVAEEAAALRSEASQIVG